MAQPIEFKVSKTLFEDVKNDPEFQMGFEAEFNISESTDLFGLKPDDFDIHESDLCVRLISPQMTLRDGLVSMYQVLESISEFEQTKFHVNLSNSHLNENKLVLFDLIKRLPAERNTSVDLSRFPRVEINASGSYGHRFDDLAKMAVRLAGMMKVANEHQPEPAQHSLIPRVWSFLHPILTPAARAAINQIAKGASTEHGPYLALSIIRSAIESKPTQNLRIREGLMMLLNDVLKIKTDDLLKALKNPAMLIKTGVMREKNPAMIPTLTNYVKWLAHPVGKAPLMNSAQPPEPKKKKKPESPSGSAMLSEYEKRRLKEKQQKMEADERERQLRRKILSEQNKRPRKTPVRWVA